MAEGGLRGALGHHARRVEREIVGSDARGEGLQRLRHLLSRCVEIDDRGPTLRRVNRDELADYENEVGVLENARLMTGDVNGARTVRLVHDRLLEEWPLLRHEVVVQREHIELRTHLEQAARDWKKGVADPSMPTDLLRRASSWVDEHPDEADRLPAVSEYVATARHKERKRRVRRGMVLAVIGIAAVVAAAFGLLATRRANQLASQSRGDTADRIATAAEDQVGRDDQLALLLAREAVFTSPTERARAALTRAVGSAEPIVWSQRHDLVDIVRYSPDGTLVATGSRRSEDAAKMEACASGAPLTEIPRAAG